MSALGLAMFGCALLAMIATGLPVYAVLLGVSVAFSALGVALGVFDLALLTALPSRLVGLLEHDLLQALPLYAFIGALLNRLPLASLLHRTGERLFRRSRASAELSALVVGALLAPMNGSVGASLHMLSKRIAPALRARGVSSAQATATVAVASTMGVVIPPSLVLLLLGDAMMRAHTEAQTLAHTAVRTVNTQDLMRAVLVPGVIVLVIALALAAWRGRGHGTRASAAPHAAGELSRGETTTAAATVLVIAGLLIGVTTGRLFAVEAAATGGLALLVCAVAGRQLDKALLRGVLDDTLLLTGLLLALLVAATTFSLVLRAYGTDAWVAQQLGTLSGQPMLLLAATLAGLVVCAFVLDAFEMIFLVVPLVMPPVLAATTDAAWVGALVLLVLQLGFLLPPFGYAVVMSRGAVPDAPSMRALARALAPQLLCQAVLIGAVLAWPQVTQWARPADLANADATLDEDAVERLMRAGGGRSTIDESAIPAAASSAAR